MYIFRVFILCAITTLSACGGGGGGSSAPVATPPSSGGTGGGTTGGGTTGGGTGGSATTLGGVISGGARLEVNQGVSGVELDVASGGTGASIDFGDIQAFGSVILNDATVNTDNAQFLIEGATGTQSDLSQGQQVLVISDSVGTNASDVVYRSNVKGPVTATPSFDDVTGSGQFTVLGQTVITDATTSFADVDPVAIVTNDLLEVSGTINDAGQIQASFVELKTSLQEYKVIGQVAGVTATTFTLAGLTVDYSSATLQDFDGSAIANDDAVEVKGLAADFTAPGQLQASRVEKLPTITIGSSASIRVEGFIDRFTSSSDFDVQTTSVSTNSSTTFVNGTEVSLALNVKVQIVGTTDANGVLVAQQITIQPTNAIRAEGNVESIDVANRTLSLLGVTFAIRDLTRLEDKTNANVDPLTLNDLGLGDRLEVRGYLDGATVVAVRVDREDQRDRARLRGPITVEDAAAGTLAILNVEITGQSGITDYEDINDAAITQAQFHDSVEVNDFVSADWDVFSATTEVADGLSIED